MRAVGGLLSVESQARLFPTPVHSAPGLEVDHVVPQQIALVAAAYGGYIIEVYTPAR